MKMKKVLAMALASAMILSLGACGSSSGDKKAEGTSDGGAKTETSSTGFAGTPEEDSYTIDLRAEPPE